MIKEPKDTSWACSARNSFDRFGCFMRQMYAMLMTFSLQVFQKAKVAKHGQYGNITEECYKGKKGHTQVYHSATIRRMERIGHKVP